MNTQSVLIRLRESLVDPAAGSLEIAGLAGSAPAWLIARLLKSVPRALLWVTPDLKGAERVAADLAFFSGRPVFVYPSHESLPFVPLVPSVDIMSQRILALSGLATETGGRIVVAPAQALAERTVPASILLNHAELLQVGEDVDRDSLLRWLVDAGYEHAAIVQFRGEFSVRGGLLDVYPPTTALPVRIDFFGDQVVEMRLFDPLSQRSVEELRELVILPCSELILSQDLVESAQERLGRLAAACDWPARKVHFLVEQLEGRRLIEGRQAFLPVLYREPATLLDYLPEGAPCIVEEPGLVDRALALFWNAAQSSYEAAFREHRVLSPLSELVSRPEEVANRLGRRVCWLLRALKIFTQEPSWSTTGTTALGMRLLEVGSVPPDLPPPSGLARRGEDLLGPAVARLKEWIARGDRVTLAAPTQRQGERIADLLKYHEIAGAGVEIPVLSCPLEEDPRQPGLAVCCGELSSGFSLPGEALTVVTEGEFLGTGRRVRHARTRGKGEVAGLVFGDLKPGSPVVHRDHGVGIYHGLVRMVAGGIPGEFLHLEYRGGDRLYLPVDRLGLIQKYVGVEGREPRLDRLGGSGWQLAKQRVKKAIYEIAHELVDLYAARKVREGTAFSPADVLFRQFEAAFPYDETPDQATSIDEVLSDMELPRPMDRLLCGDVGYGKTEVVMRAAFKAVEDGKQVGVLVPTTLLAEQHERTFRQRFRGFPVNVSAVSRLKSREEQRRALEQVRNGQTDILIGTHRLLQSDVQFRDLGLLIIDEEHRFGVRHKERLKRLKQTVDCLTLTATPIPRTLQLSLLGLRDLSVINTPPRDRIPVKTFLAEYDDALIREAIGREMERGGQVFLVHNRVKGIHRLAGHICRLVPQARVDVVHGQMEPAAMEEVMIRFVRGEVDCLVCTTIIESGIDIPSANTIIIDRADALGLADLYQLRGRVGRAGEQAYAYLFVPHISELGGESQKRLKAVMEMSAAGGGFRLAMQDLQIRGAGNILGISQSGQIAEVGYELYLDLLQDAVEELQGLPQVEEIDPEVNLRIPAYVPDGYVSDVEQRLLLYRRLARLDREDEPDFIRELEDRFGPLPREVRSLLDIMEIKRILRTLNCVRLDRTGAEPEERLMLTFGPSGPSRQDDLIADVQKNKGWRLLPDGRLILPFRIFGEEGDIAAATKRTLQGV